MDGFMGRLDEIDALADRGPGFVWRLQSTVCRYDRKQTACLARQSLSHVLWQFIIGIVIPVTYATLFHV